MSCLAHDKRFRSSFHNIINELRKENHTPVLILQSMPKQCCTCKMTTEEIIEPIIRQQYNQLPKLTNLTERVKQENQSNPKLILSLARFENLIEKNRRPTPIIPLPVTKKKTVRMSSSDSSSSSGSEDDTQAKNPVKPKKISFHSSSSDSRSSSDSEDDTQAKNPAKPKKITFPSSSGDSSSSTDSNDDLQTRNLKKSAKRIVHSSSLNTSSRSYATPMETSISKFTHRKKIKNGTFLFLPYISKGKTTDSLVDVAKILQRSRFISRNGHVGALEKQYNVRINMITPKTSKQITEALENAKQGLENLSIHNQKEAVDMSKKQDGEWLLVRSKKSENQKNTTDIDQVLDDLANRWESCLKIEKRKGDESKHSKRRRN